MPAMMRSGRKGLQASLPSFLAALGLITVLMQQTFAGKSSHSSDWAHFISSSRHKDCGNCSSLASLSWLRRYASWHAEQLQNPAQAKFLLYLCGQPDWEGVPAEARNRTYDGLCNGMGDRLRGMVEMTRLAAYSNRVLLFYWSRPLLLEDVFEPSTLDWRLKPEYKLDISNAPYYWWNRNATKEAPRLADGSWRELHNDSPLVVMRVSMYDINGRKVQPHKQHLGSLHSQERAAVYRMLFKPNQVIEERVRVQQQRLFGGTNVSYAAMHLRLGGIGGEEHVIHRFDQFKGVLSSLACTRVLAAAVNAHDTPILMITDNILLRKLVADGYFKGVVGPAVDVHPVHLDLYESGAEGHILSFVDLILLSRAKAFLASASGFSYTAMYFSHIQYANTVNKCIGYLANQNQTVQLLDRIPQQQQDQSIS